MVNVIFIDDNYVYKNYPLPKRLDRQTLISIITMEQVTSVQDLLGSALYSDIEGKVSAQTLSSSELELFKLIQYALMLYTVRSSVTLLRTSVAKTKSEEGKLDQEALDSIALAIDSKITYINKRIVNFIKADSALLTLASASTNDYFDQDDVYNGSVYYPSSGSSGTCE
jgi:hypothetical protein